MLEIIILPLYIKPIERHANVIYIYIYINGQINLYISHLKYSHIHKHIHIYT